MGTTLTIRTDDALRRALQEKADALGMGVSELVRSILLEALDDRPLRARIGSLRGGLGARKVSGPPDALRERLRKRNWRT